MGPAHGIMDIMGAGIMAARGLLTAAGAGVESHHINGHALAAAGGGANAAIQGKSIIENGG